MGTFIRTADLVRDRDLLITTLSKHLTPLSDDRRFDWLYRDNPHGPASVWLAIDEVSGETVGTSAAFPREMNVNGKKKGAWVLGDFCISEEHRSLGPALQLQRATLRGVDAGGAELCYDFPSREMTAIYKRIGISPITNVVRLTKPLRLDPKIRQFKTSEGVAKAAGWIANRVLPVFEYRSRLRDGNLSISVHEGECSHEFTELAQRAATTDGISLHRSAEYLNWRYRQHPNIDYKILAARHKNELQGYAIFNCDAEQANIAELCAMSNEVFRSLVTALVQQLRKGSIHSLNAFVTAADPRKKLFEQSGFWEREAAPLMVYWPSKQESESAQRWVITHGDRDS